MARNKEAEGLQYFEIKLSDYSSLDAIQDAPLGRALKKAFRYYLARKKGDPFAREFTEEDISDPIARAHANIALAVFRDRVDEAFARVQKKIDEQNKPSAPTTESQLDPEGSSRYQR